MKIVVVIGSGSGCGKTTVLCRILRAIPGLGAVKLSPREGDSRVEWGPGDPGKDTDLYVRSGAARVARIVGPRESAARTWGEIRSEFGDCRGVMIEGTRAIDFPEKKRVLFVAGRQSLDVREGRTSALIAISDAIMELMPRSDNIKSPFLAVSSHLLVGRHGQRTRSESCPPSVELDLFAFIRDFLQLEEPG